MVVTPPLWKRPWFIILSVLLITFLVIRYVKGREEKLKKDKEILEEKIQEGMKVVEKQKKEVEKKDKELEEKIKKEELQNWYNIGMAKFSEILSKNKDDLKKLSQSVILEFVNQLEISQGAIYILNDDDPNHHYLVLTAAYAPDDERMVGKKVEIGENEIGTCYKEQKNIIINNLPEGYATLESGLGDTSLSHLTAVPLRLNELSIGVVELISFEKISDFKISFVEKAGETLTSILTSLKAIDKTERLLKTQRQQSEEMLSQEEKLRQNLEEMQATQEEAARREDQLNRKSKEFKEREKELIDEIDRLKKKIDEDAHGE